MKLPSPYIIRLASRVVRPDKGETRSVRLQVLKSQASSVYRADELIRAWQELIPLQSTTLQSCADAETETPPRTE